MLDLWIRSGSGGGHEEVGSKEELSIMRFTICVQYLQIH